MNSPGFAINLVRRANKIITREHAKFGFLFCIHPACIYRCLKDDVNSSPSFLIVNSARI